MELNKKAAYLQGLVDGLGVDESTKEGKIIKAMAALLGEMADAIAAMDEDLTQAYDQINDLSEELEDLEADLYEDEDAEDEEDDSDDETEADDDDDNADVASEPYYQVACPACGKRRVRFSPSSVVPSGCSLSRTMRRRCCFPTRPTTSTLNGPGPRRSGLRNGYAKSTDPSHSALSWTQPSST